MVGKEFGRVWWERWEEVEVWGGGLLWVGVVNRKMGVGGVGVGGVG